jgi:hypothetical protein
MDARKLKKHERVNNFFASEPRLIPKKEEKKIEVKEEERKPEEQMPAEIYDREIGTPRIKK